MDRYELLRKYRLNRLIVIIGLGLTLANIAVYLSGVEFSFFNSFMVPQLGIKLREYYIEVGINPTFSMISMTFMTLAIYFACWYFSMKDYRWFIPGLVLFVVDTIVFALFWIITEQFTVSLATDIFIEIFILLAFVNGLRIGKKLNNDFSDAEKPSDTLEKQNVRLYRYDETMAKENNVSKKGKMITGIVLFSLILIVSIILYLIIASMNLIVGTIAFSAVNVIGFVYFFRMIDKLTPFNTAKQFVYFVKKHQICRMANDSISSLVTFENLKVVEEKSDCYICQYTNESKKKSKLIIPKCYPELEKVLRK